MDEELEGGQPLATVSGTGPLALLMDGAATPVPAIVDDSITLSVNDRVRVTPRDPGLPVVEGKI